MKDNLFLLNNMLYAPLPSGSVTTNILTHDLLTMPVIFQTRMMKQLENWRYSSFENVTKYLRSKKEFIAKQFSLMLNT